MFERKLPNSYYNLLSMLGVYIASVAIILIGLFFIVSIFFQFAANPYLGIVQFILLPMILLFGLILIPIGAVIKRRREQKKGHDERRKWPRIDFSIKSHRNAAMMLGLVSIFGIFVAAVASYQTFHFSESVDFCGKTCHEVMKPEYVAYQHSPHARVSCASCHIGQGAGWWVKSKLAGAYQVYAVLANNYPKPIPTPVRNLRPAQETCEQCHWPEKFFGAQQKRFNHTMYDDENTQWPIDILIRTGGGDARTGQAQGIHWHMNIASKVEFIARDEERQDIAWVRVNNKTTGSVTIYHDNENPLTQEEIDAASPKLMDCMDCHNRPAHVYKSPDNAIDLKILTDHIDRDLPAIKRISVEAMLGEYETEDIAMHGIATYMTDFYRAEYPEIYQEKRLAIDQAIASTQDAFKENIFPEMKVRWSAYPDNLGHFYDPGCMRCHNDRLVDVNDQTMTTDCTTCHAILSQGSGDRAEVSSTADGLEFVHPEDIDEVWKEMHCYECHTGEQP